MAQFPTEQMHLIYSPNAKGAGDLADQRFSFFDGMLVGQPDGSNVAVLAVENGSKADEAGIKAGDEIVTVGGKPTQHDLPTFAREFADARQDARTPARPVTRWTVRSRVSRTRISSHCHAPADQGPFDERAVARRASVSIALLPSWTGQ